MIPDYRIVKGSPQDLFGKLRTKVQVFGGGYGNGKTAAACVQKVLPIAMNYPGANILVARSTYPKLNDTIRKEFLKWCDPAWIKSFPRSKNSDNTCTLVNGTTINFRYIAQQGKGATDGQQTTSNLLSATYDLIVVDQMEDPEIMSKDFDDLFGRLRGSAKYIGDDPTMPKSGPRWFIIMLNPTRNWAYRRIIEPYHTYLKTGHVSDKLLVVRHARDLPDGTENPLADQPVYNDEGKPILLMGMVEGSTYTNKHNLDSDFITSLESIYRGQSRDRFLYGEWASYEGLVHPAFNEDVHCIPRHEMAILYENLTAMGVQPTFIEGYDFGIAVPSCYLAAFVDRFKNVFVFDGFYLPEERMHIDAQQKEIWRIRNDWGIEDETIRADPAIFRRTSVRKSSGSKTIAQLFGEGSNAVRMAASDNEVIRGITKVNTYLQHSERHRHPINGGLDAPHIYFATELEFIASEFAGYFWKVDGGGDRYDVPIDKNDHAMNTLKYLIAKQPDLAQRIPRIRRQPYLTQWQEMPGSDGENKAAHRYG